FSFCVFLIISFYFASKYFDDKIALLLAILLAFSPLNMAMARRALLDSTFNLFCILSIWLFFDLLKKRTALKYVLFILIYSFTILVKETGVLLSVFFLLYLIFYKDKKYLLPVTLFPFLIAGVVYLILAGGPSNMIKAIKIILTSPSHNEYAILFGSGPWFRYLIDYMLLSPWVVILSSGFIFWHLASKEHDERVSYFLLAFVVLFFSLNFFTKNVRYVMALDMPMRLFSVLMLKKLFETRFPKQALLLVSVSVIAIAVFDYLNFHSLFVRGEIYDPVSYWLLKIEHIIPWR
ncbi:MAG: glycosyltransferase family 39 protein, partial [Candidatus Omnitrophota bacterium]|nr:glycosyltransferase family 39 protein [Candidatus Omnitrophota bacterium]